jgi:nicotinamidase/pyrazinamidase
MSSPGQSGPVVFWEVDVQADFMLPGGALYVRGAGKIIPNLKRLIDAARRNEVFLVSSACQHSTDDPEFKTFGPHCVRGTPGAQIIPEGLAQKRLTVPSGKDFSWPAGLLRDYQQVILEKQELDVFSNPQTQVLLDRLEHSVQFVVFGVATDYCVGLATNGLLKRGKIVSIVKDAIAAIDSAAGEATLSKASQMGAKFIATDEALALVKKN